MWKPTFGICLVACSLILNISLTVHAKVKADPCARSRERRKAATEINNDFPLANYHNSYVEMATHIGTDILPKNCDWRRPELINAFCARIKKDLDDHKITVDHYNQAKAAIGKYGRCP